MTLPIPGSEVRPSAATLRAQAKREQARADKKQEAAAQAGAMATGGTHGLWLGEAPTMEARWYGAAPIIQVYVHGNPAPQGSKREAGRIQLGGGKSRTRLVEASKGLEPWRNAIRAAMEDIIRDIPGWKPIAFPVRIQAAFTMPDSAAARKRGDVFHTNTPDLDKLQRGLGDALSPTPLPPSFGKPKGKGAMVPPPTELRALRAAEMERRRAKCFLSDDSQIVSWDAVKVYPSRSPISLPSPGVFFAIYRA